MTELAFCTQNGFPDRGHVMVPKISREAPMAPWTHRAEGRDHPHEAWCILLMRQNVEALFELLGLLPAHHHVDATFLRASLAASRTAMLKVPAM